jgi:glucokinase
VVDARYYLCLDFGGTKLAAGIVDATTGQVVERERRPTPSTQGAEQSLLAAVAACDAVLARAAIPLDQLGGIGISFGGPLGRDRRRVIRSMHVDSWEQTALPDALARRFGMAAVMENDANAAALAEARCGAGRGLRDLLYVQVSTGIGSGLLVGGALYRGRGGAGELGHVVVDPEGPRCVCGKRGCLESLAAGWAIARDGERAAVGSDAEEVIAAARSGDEAAGEIVARAFSAVGVAVANAINLLDPERVVLGGGIASADDLLLPPLHAALAEHVVPHLGDLTRVVLSQLGPDPPLVGAAIAADERPRPTFT